MKRFFTRLEIQEILERNDIGADVYYLERENKASENAIVYYRSNVSQMFSDDQRHLNKVKVTIAHYRKTKLDSIESLINENFNGLFTSTSSIKDIETDYFINYYDLEILSNMDW